VSKMLATAQAKTEVGQRNAKLQDPKCIIRTAVDKMRFGSSSHCVVCPPTDVDFLLKYIYASKNSSVTEPKDLLSSFFISLLTSRGT
jgi:hypothetical protein